MAKKSNTENYDVIGGIFDFIFKESRKPADKRRPVRIEEGIATDRALMDMIGSALEAPGVFVSDTVLDDLNDSLDVEIAKFDFGSQGSVKISSTNLVDLIKDPAKFVDDQRKRAEGQRKASRARFLGGVMDDILTTAWAHKYGDTEAKAISLANATANEKTESYKIARALGESYKATLGGSQPGALDFMADRSVQLLARETFGSSWDSMNERDKIEFTQLVSGLSSKKDSYGVPLKNVKQSEVLEYLKSKYSGKEEKAFYLATEAILRRGQEDKIDIFEPRLYKHLEKKHLNEKIGALGNAPAGSQDEKDRRTYEKMRLMIDRDSAKMLEHISNLKKEISTTTDPNRKKELRKELSDSNRALGIINGNTLFGQIGKVEGYYNSLTQVWGTNGSNVLPSILNGKFFSKQNTVLNPVNENGTQFAGVEILLAKKSDKSILNAYNKAGESLYYLTPRSLLKTFFYNGEGFARLLHNNLAGMEKTMTAGGFGGTFEELMNVMGREDMMGKLGGDKFKSIDEYLDITYKQLLAKNKSLSPAQLAQLEKMFKSAGSLRKLTNTFSTASRAIEKLKGVYTKIFERQAKKFRASIGRRLLQNQTFRKWLVKSGGAKLLGKWIASGGVKVLVQSVVTAIAGAIGMVGTPIASVVIAALTWIATDLLMKLLKGFLELGKLMFLGILGLIVVIIGISSGSMRKFNKTTYSYTNVVPGDVVACTQYEELPVVPGEEPWGPVPIPPPSGETCVLGSQGIGCSQGFIDVACWSHKNMTAVKPVDLTNVSYIYAPQFCNTGDCKITDVRKINCTDGSNAGGVVVLSANDGSTTYTFKLLHVQPLAAVGEKLSSGQPVAMVQMDLEEGWCWTGPHLHLETKQNGSVVDPLALLKTFNCSVPNESQCPDAPTNCPK